MKMNSSRSPEQPSAIRLGAISFVNTIPVYSAYTPSEDVHLVYDVPARLNALMRSGLLDVSPVSSVCYLQNRENWVLLEDLSVSSPGAVESVLFLSRAPLGPAMRKMSAISVPDDSETSVALLACLLKEDLGGDPGDRFCIYPADAWAEAFRKTGNALVIGDNALLTKTMKNRRTILGEPHYCYDLSTLWRKRTGLPFVFAVWAADRLWAERNPEALQRINRELRMARNRFFRESSVMEAGIVQAKSRSGLSRSTLLRYYLRCLTYTLDAGHYASLEHFHALISPPARQESCR